MTRIFVSICDPFFQYDDRSYIFISHRIDYKTNDFGYSVVYLFNSCSLIKKDANSWYIC
jgi:hypothetical protein